MRFVLFYHSLVSDWNHGNAHFLRGVVTELLTRGHQVRVCEPEDAWSRENLFKDQGREASLEAFSEAYPGLFGTLYRPQAPDLDSLCDGADVILVHEWNDPALVQAVGDYRRRTPWVRVLFHDTHHRAVTAPHQIAVDHLSGYDGTLVYGQVLREIYLKHRWTRRCWVWHEAADTRLFRPLQGRGIAGDLVWIGNWGDDERTAELEELLIRPVVDLKLKATIHGVRYPRTALRRLRRAGIAYAGYLPNFRVPEVFAEHRVTVHVPRRPYVQALPGIPTIRVFEALACGIPLASARWEDCESLFGPGDFALAHDGREMVEVLRRLLAEPERAAAQAEAGLQSIRSRHTCGHRAQELLRICAELGAGTAAPMCDDAVAVRPLRGNGQLGHTPKRHAHNGHATHPLTAPKPSSVGGQEGAR